MGKAPKFGVNTYHKRTRRKRPGRHAKNQIKKILKKSIEDKEDESSKNNRKKSTYSNFSL